MGNNSNTFDFFKKKDKHFFAGLFNTAMNNFDLSLHELNKRMGKDIKKGINVISYAFSKDRTQLDFDNNYKYLSESLFFLKRIPAFINKQNRDNEKTPNYNKITFKDFFPTFIKNLYKASNNYRNYYTHFEHNEDKLNKDEYIAKFIDYIIFNSASRIKEDRVKEEEEKARLKEEYATDINIIFNEKNIHIDSLNIEKSKERKKLIEHIKPKDKANFALNKMFQLFFYDIVIERKGLKNSKEKPTKETILNEFIKNNKEENKLTTGGLIQLLALFLNKRQINLLFDNVNYTYNINDTDLQKKVARMVFTLESYKTIKHLFKSEYDNDSLLLQMVSELSKCPKNLYPILNQSHKNEFLEDVNIYLKEDYDILNDDALVSHKVIRKRYEDRFAYFAIRFLDEFAKFPTLRFHVNLGKFNHNTKLKRIKSSGLETERKILERISIFEKLSEATKKKNTYFENLKEKEKDEDWVEYPSPKYQFFNKNIGIWLGSPKDLKKAAIVDDRKTKEKITKYTILEKLELKNSIKKPVAYLSFNELPALLHALLIKGTSTQEIEKQIKDKINLQKKEISGIINNKANLTTEELKKLPKVLKKILTKDSDVDYPKLTRHLEGESKKNPLQEIRDLYKMPLKKHEVLTLSEKGKIATWLSKDIKRFVKKEVKKEWKGYQFSEFQSLLSYYDVDKYKIATFLRKDLLLDVDNHLPFYGINFDNLNFYDFYIYYLDARNAYLKGLHDDIIEFEDYKTPEILLLPFDKSKFSIKSLDDYKEALKKHPAMLKRGVFDTKPTAAKKEAKLNTNFADWFAVSSNSQDAQKFYSYPKHYLVSNGVKNTIKADKGIKEQYLGVTSKKDQRDIYTNESILRKTMRNDFYLLQMVKFVFKKYNEVDNSIFDKLTLKEFYLTKAEKEKYIQDSATQKDRKQGDKRLNIYNQSYILSKPVFIDLCNGKIKGQVKLKNTSKYKKLSQDRRVKELTNYFKDYWSFEAIKNEISNYEHIRSKVFFKSIHALEKIIFEEAQNNNELEIINNEGVPNFKKYVTYFFLKDAAIIDDFNEIEIDTTDVATVSKIFRPLFLLIQIRNKFAHNELVPKSSFDYLITKYKMEQDEKVATYLNRVYNNIIKTVKN